VVRHVSLLNGPVYFIFRRGDDAGHVDLRQCRSCGFGAQGDINFF
jgi:hypothetical protein